MCNYILSPLAADNPTHLEARSSAGIMITIYGVDILRLNKYSVKHYERKPMPQFLAGVT